MLAFTIIIALCIAGAVFFYLKVLLADSLGLRGTTTLGVIAIVALCCGVMAFVGIKMGWIAVFIVLAALVCFGQFWHLEAWWPPIILALAIFAQLPTLAAGIYNDIQIGNWDFLKWIFQFLALPFIEIGVYLFVTNLSRYMDARQELADQDEKSDPADS